MDFCRYLQTKELFSERNYWLSDKFPFQQNPRSFHKWILLFFVKWASTLTSILHKSSMFKLLCTLKYKFWGRVVLQQLLQFQMVCYLITFNS